MKIYSSQNVLDAALDRIRWLYSEFDNIIVNFSGGKDSTVVLNLTLMVAEELGRLPVPVLFIDQECEFQATVDYVEGIMTDPRVKPFWMQCPLRISNGASTDDDWLYCWEEGKNWIHPKSDLSYHENTFGTLTFGNLFVRVSESLIAPEGSICKIGGVRAEESPGRLKGLTSYATYKGRTWGRKENMKRPHVTMYPIYDWSFKDVWKAIHEHGWGYCKIYDYQYQYGVPVRNMRVSSLHHETALTSLYYLQEVEPDTWAAVTERLQGMQAVAQMKQEFMMPKELPWMFKDWAEYRDHLIDKLVEDPKKKAYFQTAFPKWIELFESVVHDKLIKTQIKAVLTDDYHGQRFRVFLASNGQYSKNRGTKGGDASERTVGRWPR